ncbi:DoxX family protein [Metabacillus fastidiosus]|uniref:DoxX family protein n=1 Tax=Metabacillus fastidiosus TaxID=1458 RepID=UPI003D2DCAC4
MTVIMIVLKIILGGFVGLGGLIKVFQFNFQVEHWRAYEYPLWFMTVTGVLELLASIALFAGFGNRYLTIIGSLIIFAVMIGAVYTHIFRAEQPLVTVIPSAVCLMFAFIILIKG